MIQVVKVKDRDKGQVKAHGLLLDLVDKDTLLALSGGTSVDYRSMIVKPPLRQGFEGQADDIIPGAICIVDERYGEPFHKDSNEKLLLDQGVKRFADDKCIETHKVLKGANLEETAKLYDLEIRDLFARFKKKVGVMGVGTNLHTAGIFPASYMAHSPGYVVWDEVEDKYPERISLTLKALGEFTDFIIMIFGREKKEALKIMLDEKEHDMQKYPAIFYRKSRIKTWLITDIEI